MHKCLPWKGSTQEEFDKKCFAKHKGKYKCLDKYQGDRVKLRFVCDKHGIFEQTPSCHMKGGCDKCRIDSYRMTQEQFDKKRYEVHGDKYKCLDPYATSYKHLRFECPDHGVFSQAPAMHLSRNGCPKCGREEGDHRRKLSEEEWQLNRSQIHGDKYECLDLYVNNHTKLRFVCPEHGIFKMTPNAHIDQSQGCPYCKESKGEKKIDLFLKRSGLGYHREFRFMDCKHKLPLPFDFHIPSLNLVVEYDGEQHFRAVNRFGGTAGLKKIQTNDQIKNDYCKTNNIKLVRIPYTHFGEIETILDFVLENLKLAA